MPHRKMLELCRSVLLVVALTAPVVGLARETQAQAQNAGSQQVRAVQRGLRTIDSLARTGERVILAGNRLTERRLLQVSSAGGDVEAEADRIKQGIRSQRIRFENQLRSYVDSATVELSGSAQSAPVVSRGLIQSLRVRVGPSLYASLNIPVGLRLRVTELFGDRTAPSLIETVEAARDAAILRLLDAEAEAIAETDQILSEIGP